MNDGIQELNQLVRQACVRDFLMSIPDVINAIQNRFFTMSLEHRLQVKIVDRLLLSDIKRIDLTPEAYMPYLNPHFPLC
jgi:hypothetical protein